MKSIAILGATGSIGLNCLKVLDEYRDSFSLDLISAHKNHQAIIDIIKKYKPKITIITDYESYKIVRSSVSGNVLFGMDELLSSLSCKFDLVFSAIAGMEGLLPTIEAIRSGSNIALANKESIVSAGKLMLIEADKSKSKIIPIDSEHNAIFQVLDNNNLDKIESIILTASGGPFYKLNKEQTKEVNLSDAIVHPNWKMGKKITIDSATMMNKGFELIEAGYLFGLPEDKIKTIIHPESIIHGIVNYADGSSLAALSFPDMKIPISYAFSYPKRLSINHKRLNLIEIGSLNFLELNEERFKTVKFARQVLKMDNFSSLILNIANDLAVDLFLEGRIKFFEIEEFIEIALNKIEIKTINSFEDLLLFQSECKITITQLYEGIIKKCLIC